MSSRRLIGLIAGLLLAGPVGWASEGTAPAPGDLVEVHLGNGDRVSGRLLSREQGVVRVQSPLLGEIAVAEAAASVVAAPTEEPVAPSISAVPKNPAPAVASAPVEKPAEKKAEGVKPAAKPWKTKLELGFVQQSGRKDTLNYDLRGETERTVRRHRLRGTARMLYAEQNNKPSADREEAVFRWRYDLGQGFFTQSQSSYFQDEITGIHSNIEQGAALGYKVLALERHEMNVGAGGTAQYRDWDAGSNGVSPYVEVFQDYVYQINPRISLRQDAGVQYSPSDRAISRPGVVASPELENYKLRFNGALQGKVTDHVTANLRYEYEWDNTIALRENRGLQRITSSIGYTF